MKKNKTNNKNTNRTKLLIDMVAFVLLSIVCAPQVTGIAWHEYLSIIFAVPIVIHLLLNWPWIVNVLQRFTKKLPGQTRFNQIWNIVLFILMVEVTLSGLLISEAVLPDLGITVVIDSFWVTLHNTTANIFLLLMGVHLAMHWMWITAMFKRLVGQTSKPVVAAE